QLGVAADAEGPGHGARGLDLEGVDLAVADRQRVQREALGGDHRRRGVGIEAPAQEQDGIGHPRVSQTPRVSGLQMYLCSWTCRRTVRWSSRIQVARSCGSSTPWTGEKSTAATRPVSPWRATTSRAYS